MHDPKSLRRLDGRDRPTAADDWEFDPLVPLCPGSSSDPERALPRPSGRPPFDRPPRTDHAPYDRDAEEIEPLVPDLR